MNVSQAGKLAAKLKLGALHAEIEGDRIVFLGGTTGSHSLAIDVSSPARVRAHWKGYVSAQPRGPVAAKHYVVTVEGSAKDREVGWHRVVGWVRVRAPSESEAKRAARATPASQVTWESEGDARDPLSVVRVIGVEVEG